mgnify:CR=1 FL=1
MTPVIICGADLNQPDFDYTMQELANLAEACDMEVKDTVIQKLERPVSASYVGRGKAEEIKTQGKIHDAKILIVNDELTPMQIRNLGDLTDMKIIDRTALILEIFASRARSKEAKLQVQIAKLRISLPRLHTDNDKVKLDQQTGGGSGSFNSRGGGETKLEKDRRVIGKRISILKKELKDIEEKQNVTRKQRDASGLRSVALVGYTNAGKSTLLNCLTGSDIPANDRLFDTLDTTTRLLTVSDTLDVVISDTVGFIRKLPTELVESFKSTLDEVREADLLVHVVDISHPTFEEQIEVVNRTLSEIDKTEKPMIMVFNKIDAFTFVPKDEDDLTPRTRENIDLDELKRTWMNKMQDNCIFISAKERTNIDALKALLYERVKQIHITRFPYNDFLFQQYDEE